MLLIACVSLLALLLFGVPITFSLMGAGYLAVLLGDGNLQMYMKTTNLYPKDCFHLGHCLYKRLH